MTSSRANRGRTVSTGIRVLRYGYGYRTVKGLRDLRLDCEGLVCDVKIRPKHDAMTEITWNTRSVHLGTIWHSC